MSSNKTLDTLVEDIYELFNPNKTHIPSEENLDKVAESIKNILRTRLAERENTRDPLRISAIGKPDRQLWFMAHPDGNEEEISSKTYFKFLYGDIIEQLILFLAREAGHTVEDEQAEIEINGVTGHIDARIDGVIVDVKSASPTGYKKFEQARVVEDDPFGYVAQLSGYSFVLNPGEPAAWIAFDKVHGDICVSKLSYSIIQHNEPGPRIEHLKEVIASENIPPLCYDPVPDGKSGNMKLPTPCGYCAHKKRCHPNLRTFLYGNGPRFLTTVAKLPDVPEVVGKDLNDETEDS